MESSSSFSSVGRSQKMNEVVCRILQWPFILHTALVMFVIWILSLTGFNYPIAYIIGFIFLFHVENRHREKMVRRIRHQERKYASQKQLLSDFESVKWLNETVAKAWPVFLEKFASQDFLAPLMPFFLAKYKPWTVQDAALQSFSLGRNPPIFAGMRAVDSSATDDDMVLEATMEFLAADDMDAVLSVQLRKRLGGISTKIHMSKLHIEGKVRIGIRFIGGFPFISRLRVSFENTPYLQIEARPLTNYGMDMAELPGVASWLDTMLNDALEDSIVKPNMLVINVERLANTWTSAGYTSLPSVDTPPVAVAVLEILEAAQLKPADVNGLADPFVKGVLNTNRFKTSIKWKTLNPKWMEVFRLPIKSWDIQNRLIFHVRDKDLFRDDNLGYCDVLLSKFRDGNRHELCLPLKGVKTGRLTFAITIEEIPQSPQCKTEEEFPSVDTEESYTAETPSSDRYEVIDTGVSPSGIFSILRPGKAVQKRWRGRKGRKVDKVDDNVDLPDNTLFSGPLEPPQSDNGDSDDDKSDKHGRKKFWRWRGRDRRSVSGELVTDVGRVKLRTMIGTDVDDRSPSSPSVKTPAKTESTPVKHELLPAKTELIPVKHESLPTKSESIPVKHESLPAKTESIPVKTESIPVKPEDLPLETAPAEDGTQTDPKSATESSIQDGDSKLKTDASVQRGGLKLRTEDSMHSGELSVDEPDAVISPGRRSMRERAKGVVKHAEKTAAHIGHIGHNLFRRKSGKDLPSPHLSNQLSGCLCSPEREAKAAGSGD